MEYDKIEYNNLIEGVTFKFRKLNAVEHLELAMDSALWEQKKIPTKEMLNKIFTNILFTKDGKTTRELVDKEGNTNLPELDENPSVALDLFYKFKEEVVFPVFSESKTFHKDTHQ